MPRLPCWRSSPKSISGGCTWARVSARSSHTRPQRLRLSEPAAYSRITAARLSRRFPIVLSLIDDGGATLTTVGLLAAHLTEENHEALLGAAAHKSKRDVERIVAALHPLPDIAASVRALPAARSDRATPVEAAPASTLAAPAPVLNCPAAAPVAASTSRHALVAPLAPRRYLIRMTVSEATHDKLQQATDLLRHTIPDGDPAAVVDRALTVLVDQLLRTKAAAVARPRSASRPSRRAGVKSRHVPAPVRRAVWARDQGRCAFVGTAGRCHATGRLEFHHVVPFASGGPTTVENIQLRCRGHNAYEGELAFGDWRGRPRGMRTADGEPATARELRPDGVGP